MGKGSKRRPSKISIKEFDDKYDKIFGKPQRNSGKNEYVWSDKEQKFVNVEDLEVQHESKSAELILKDRSDEYRGVRMSSRQANALRKNPYFTTAGDRREEIKKASEKAKEMRYG